MSPLIRHVVSAASVCMLLVACKPSIAPMTPEQAQRIAQWTQQTKTRCIGRHLIDLPTVFVLNTESVAEIGKVKVTVKPMSRNHFDRLLEVKKAELERERMNNEERQPALRSTTSLVEPLHGYWFDRAKMPSMGDRQSRILDAFGWLEGYAITASTEAVDSSFPELRDDVLSQRIGTNMLEMTAALLDVASRTRGRADEEVPSEQGLCIANGFIATPPREGEEINVFYHLEGSPDLYFHMSSTTVVRETNTMLERSAQIEKEMSASGTKTLRKGKREVAGIQAEEWLFSGPTPDRVQGTMFDFSANETTRELSKPFIVFSLHNGFRIPAAERTMEESAQLKDLTKASLSDAEAMALWDAVTPTIKPRAGAL